jgi:ACS family hexuronate transporter-like MFS transporter
VSIQKDLSISNQGYASIINFFLIAYTIANLLSGRVVDKLGVRLSLALFVGWWTIANAFTGLARSLTQLCGLRFMLGLGEAGCYTASPKAVAEWFPVSERGTAVGIYSAGGAVGATLAPVMVALVAGNFGWRWVFAVTPVLAGLWLLLWLWLYKNPATHPHMTDKERNFLAVNLAATQAAAAAQPKESELALWKGVLREPLVWQLMLARLITDPVWYFFQFWFPKYLQNVRGLDQKGVAIMWMIFAAATVGFILGGFFSGRLVRRGSLPPAARLWIMLMSAALVPLVGFVPAIPSVMGVIGIAMVVAYAATAWLSNITSLVVDLVPQRILGTAFGVIACGSALGGFFMNKGVAWLIDHRSYDDSFYIMAVAHPVALLLVWRLRKRANAV